MLEECPTDQGGCGTWHAVGLTMCPNCQRPVDQPEQEETDVPDDDDDDVMVTVTDANKETTILTDYDD